MPPAPRPTTEQLGVSASTILRRGLLLQCPACGKRGLIQRWFGIAERCPTCDLRVERIEGHMIGYIGLNVVVSFTVTFVVLMAMSFASIPDVDPLRIALVSAVPAFLGPILFAPGSRTTWTAIDLLMRPLQPGEIDPRFVKVDAARDGPPAAQP